MPLPTSTVLLAAISLNWIPQVSTTDQSLRGLSVVSDHVVWACGAHGTILRTTDGGTHWSHIAIPKTEVLDFRDIVGFSPAVALVMSSGTGEASRVYITRDGGKTWQLTLSNPDPTGFFNAIKFWDRQHGMLLGDPVGGKFTVLTTGDGGLTWKTATQPLALKDEGAFAASGTCLTLRPNHSAWFASGGPGAARVFQSSDGGKSWTVATTPLSGTTNASGIFSLQFQDSNHGIAVGGDYQLPTQIDRTLALTNDGGKTWTVPAIQFMGGFRSAVAYLKQDRLWLTVGTTGSDYSNDGGITWTHLSNDSLNALATDGHHTWAVGPKGIILKLDFAR